MGNKPGGTAKGGSEGKTKGSAAPVQKAAAATSPEAASESDAATRTRSVSTASDEGGAPEAL